MTEANELEAQLFQITALCLQSVKLHWELVAELVFTRIYVDLVRRRHDYKIMILSADYEFTCFWAMRLNSSSVQVILLWTVNVTRPPAADVSPVKGCCGFKKVWDRPAPRQKHRRLIFRDQSHFLPILFNNHRADLAPLLVPRSLNTSEQ